MSCNIRLLISCPDKKGLIAAISAFITMHDGNILSADQYVSVEGSETFFMRLEIEGEGFGLERDEFGAAFAPLARRHGMDWSISYTDTLKKVAILVSRYDHCLIDLLWRWDAGELDAEIPLVVSNHPDLAPRAGVYGISFHYLPVTKETRAGQEARVLDLLSEGEVDFVVLARYMRILGPKFVHAYPDRILNIHHSFLPAFVGADPYRRAHDRGVKTIGATAHYVTEDLDAGPIIHQNVAHIIHRDTVEDLIRLGCEVERSVLARAVRWYLEDRVLVDGNRTVVFEAECEATVQGDEEDHAAEDSGGGLHPADCRQFVDSVQAEAEEGQQDDRCKQGFAEHTDNPQKQQDGGEGEVEHPQGGVGGVRR